MISIIIKSVKHDDFVDNIKYTSNGYKRWKDYNGDISTSKIIEPEYLYAYNNWLKPSRDMFEMMFLSLSEQTYKDFEIILVHRNPDKINKQVLLDWKEKLNLKVVKSKHTKWYDMGPQYSDVASNLNTGIIWADGDLVLSLNDECMIGKTYLSEVAKLYKFNRLGIGKRTYYWVVNDLKQPYDEYIKDKTKLDSIWGEDIFDERFCRRELFPNTNRSYTERCAMWGHAMTFPLNIALDINGFDETYDGWVDVDEMDFTNRFFSYTNRYTPTMMKNTVYSLSIPHWLGNNIIQKKRNGKAFMNILYSENFNTRANDTRPKKESIEKYIKWHKENDILSLLDEGGIYGSMKIDTFNLRNLRKFRNQNEALCGKLYV